MNIDTFRQMYVSELQELYSVETQLTEALPKMLDTARRVELKEVLRNHLQETRSQRDRLEELLRRHKAAPHEHVDQSMQAIVREADKWAGMIEDTDLRDAGLIASAQRVEHYDIAIYGTLATWADQLGLDEDLFILHAILDEERRADEKLTAIAKQAVNREAVAAA
jgi:ferritin-like metal-binding protein YciE